MPPPRWREPSVPARSFRWKRHTDQAAVKTFAQMMIDRCPQIFQIATRPTWTTARLDVLAASKRIHFGQPLAAEEII